MKFCEIEKLKQLDSFDAECIESIRNAALVNDDVYELIRVIALCCKMTDANRLTFEGDKYDVKVIQNAVFAFSVAANDRTTEK